MSRVGGCAPCSGGYLRFPAESPHIMRTGQTRTLNLDTMDEHQHDDEIFEPHTDGELSEDALFEWDGQEWVSVEHDPFVGYDEPQEWIEPPREVDPASEYTRIIDPDAFFDSGVQYNYNATVNEQSRYLQTALKVLGGLVALAFIFFFVNNEANDNALGNTGALISTATASAPSPLTQVASLGNGQSTATSSQTPIRTATSTRTPRPTRAPVYQSCYALLPQPAYIFTSNNRIFVRSLNDMQNTCLLTSIGQDASDPQLSSDGTQLYFLASGRIRMMNVITDESRILNNFVEGGIQHFDLSPDDTRLVYERDEMLFIYDLQTGNITDFSQIPDLQPMHFPVWSADGRDIYFSSGSQIVRVSADGSDYQVMYANRGQYAQFYDLAVSDDGERLAVVYRPSNSLSGKGLLMMDMVSWFSREIIADGQNDISDPHWLDGHNEIAVMEMLDSAESPRIAIYAPFGSTTTVLNSLEPAMNAMTGFDLWYGSEE